MKPVHTITREYSLLVHINKKGRPVQLAIAEAYVKKKWPDKAWVFKKSDHSIIAEEMITS